MPRYEFKEGTSSKFWEITLSGTSFTTTYGRIGTDGQSTTKSFKTEAEAKKEHDKLVAEKTKKGYVLAGGGGGAKPAAAGAAPAPQPLVGLEKEISHSEHPKKFAFRRIVDFDPEVGLKEAAKGVAYRISVEYDGEHDFAALFGQLLADERVAEVQGLVIGSWHAELGSGTDSRPVIEALVGAKDQLANLRALFLGDVIQEECEMSWLEQADFAPVVAAFRKLEHLRVRGPKVMAPLKSDSLRSLALETGGLDDGIVTNLAKSRLPALEHLELWLGIEDYGGDTSVEDLVPILSGKLFPKLRYLGLRNSELADAIATALATAPVVARLDTLDLSLGTLTDAGAEALLASASIAKLKRLDLHHHYVSEPMAAKLRKLGTTDVDLRDRQDPDEYDGGVERYTAVGE